MKHSHVIFDLDGTLLPDGAALDQKALKRLGEQLRASGQAVVFATGRDMAKVLELDGVVGALAPVAIVANCGAEIFLKQGDDYINDAQYQQHLRDNGEFFEHHAIDTYLGQFEFLIRQERKYQFDYKVSYYIDLKKCDSARSFVEAFRARFEGHELLISLAKVGSVFHYLDVQPIHGTKYSALAYMLEGMGVNQVNVKYFGDNGNDLPCVLGFKQAAMIATHKESLVDIYPELSVKDVSWIEDPGPASLLGFIE